MNLPGGLSRNNHQCDPNAAIRAGCEILFRDDRFSTMRYLTDQLNDVWLCPHI